MVSLGQYVINCWSNYFVSKCVAINKSLKTSFHTEKTKDSSSCDDNNMATFKDESHHNRTGGCFRTFVNKFTRLKKRKKAARRRKKKTNEDEEQCSWLKCCHRCQEIYNSDTQTPDGTPLPPVPSMGGIFTLTHDNSLTALSNYHANYCNQYWSYGFDAPIYHTQISGQLSSSGLVAPISSLSPASQRSPVNHAIRSVILCKDGDGKVGLRVKSIDKGVFVALVTKGSPAAMGGLRFGDQILQINGENIAGFDEQKVHKIFKKAGVNNICLAVRDRPFERTLTLHKDSTGHIGFQFKEGEIKAIVVGSSAARNGLLINHHLVEVNGQNVVGLNDKSIQEIIESGGAVVTVTVIPSMLFKHMIKNMSQSIVKKMMDHSIPDM